MNVVAATICMVWGFVIHVFTDWLVQTDWMAQNKASLKHAASWAHGFSFFPLFLIIFPWYIAFLLSLSHVLIDTRVPVKWFFKVAKKTDLFWLVICVDQALHIALIAIASLVVGFMS